MNVSTPVPNAPTRFTKSWKLVTQIAMHDRSNTTTLRKKILRGLQRPSSTYGWPFSKISNAQSSCKGNEKKTLMQVAAMMARVVKSSGSKLKKKRGSVCWPNAKYTFTPTSMKITQIASVA